jgi:hypothetical protein
MSPAGLGGLFGLMALINVIGSQPAAYISDKVCGKVRFWAKL